MYVKYVVDAMSFMFPFELCRGMYESAGTIFSLAGQKCDAMSPDHPEGLVPAPCVALVRNSTNQANKNNVKIDEATRNCASIFDAISKANI